MYLQELKILNSIPVTSVGKVCFNQKPEILCLNRPKFMERDSQFTCACKFTQPISTCRLLGVIEKPAEVKYTIFIRL